MEELNTLLGKIKGIEKEHSYSYLGLPFGKTEKRFSYAKLVTDLGDTVFDATHFGPACTQKRTYYEHLEIPERKFYHKEFRDGIHFDYSEDCLNLNIYTPKKKGTYPVLVFIHGGGFDSGANSESPFDGDNFAKEGIVTVFIQYRVGVFGYFTSEELLKEYGHEGNFGFSDQILALEWVKKYISFFYGDPNNVTIMGQSAGAMSIQALLISPKAKNLFQKTIMMSGGGLFPSLATPKRVEDRREYWSSLMKECSCSSLEEFRNLPDKKIFDALETFKKKRKDNQISTMTMVDGYYLTMEEEKALKEKIDVPTIIGFTNNDMYTILLADMALKYAKKNKAYCYYFDVDAKGDDNQAFHSSDLRYAFKTLNRSWRPYTKEDYDISDTMVEYFSDFMKTGNPNGEGLPRWEIKKGEALRFAYDKISMAKPKKMKLIRNTFKGDPK